jgi:amidase
MKTAAPSRSELEEHARRAFLSLDEDELDDMHELVQGLLEMIERLEEQEEPDFGLVPRDAQRDPGRRPTPEENPYNAWITRCEVRGASDGVLAGKTVGLKDNIPLAGVEMTCASRMLEGYVPTIDATVVTRLLEAGATIVGKLNMESFAFSGSGDVSDFGDVLNPRNLDYLAGGSSSGSGVAPAAGDCDVAIGADQGGSIRMPSAWCGIVGIKPTSGLVPYTGIFSIDMSIDHVGPHGRTVDDVARTLTAIAGEDVRNGVKMDPRQPHGVEAGDYLGALGAGVDGLRIGLLEEGIEWENSDAVVDDAIRRAVDAFGELGAEVKRVSVPQHRVSQSLWANIGVQGGGDLIQLEGVGTNFDGWYNTELLQTFRKARLERADEFPPTMKSAMLAASILRERSGGREYARAQNIALGLRQAYGRALEEVDLLAMPTTPMLPFRRDTGLTRLERIGRTLDNLMNTAPFDLTAHPAISVPCGSSDEGLPIGLMLVGRHFEEETLIRAAHAFEQASDGT